MFGTIPSEWSLAKLVGWIAGDEAKDPLADLVSSLLPEPDEDLLEGCPWLREAWSSHRAPMKTAAYLWCMEHFGWHEDERRDDLAALEDFTRKYAIDIRRCLMQPSDATQIAEDLAVLSDVLDQGVAEATAAFIIEMIADAQLPPYVLHELFKRVAMIEGGKIKPASFNRFLPGMQARVKEARRISHDARAFVEQLEPALACVRANLGGEREVG